MDDDFKWRPPGHDFFYRMKFDSGIPGAVFEGSVTVPEGESVDMATAVVRRIGGSTPADDAYRRELFFRIGEVTALASQIEAGLKRVCVLLTDPHHGHFDQVEAMFSKLEKTAKVTTGRVLADPSTSEDKRERARQLQSILDWSASESLVTLRNNIVHAVWWDFAGLPPFMSRFNMKGEASMHVAADLDEAFAVSSLLREYVNKLDVLIRDDWFTIFLPRGGV